MMNMIERERERKCLFWKIYNKLVQIIRRDVFLKCKRALQPE